MLITKALHLIAIVAWFAGLFYLPRIFIYHLGAENPQCKAMLNTMASRLYRFIMNPAVTLVFFFGIGLFSSNAAYYLHTPWFWGKIFFIVLLLAFHIACGQFMRRLAAGNAVPSVRFFRWFNEIPTLCLIAIVLLVVLKP